MVFFLSFFIDNPLQAQRIRFGYEYPCYEQPAPLPPITAAPEPTLCERMPEQGTVIKIGVGTKIPNSSDLNAFLGTNSAYNLHLKVFGDFFIDETIVLTACALSIAKDKTITVGPEVSLTSIRSKFFCCDGMWNGIVVQNDASLDLFDFTEIEDAYKAVSATNTAYDIKIQGTTFNRNQVACSFTSEVSQGSAIVPLTIFLDNLFTCTSELNIQTGYRWAVCGVKVIDATIPTLGTLGSNANLFTGNICNGIYLSNRASAVINNCQFVKIYADFATLPDNLFETGAYAVVATESAGLDFTGLGGTKDSPFTFDNNAKGAVYTNASWVKIDSSAVRSVEEDFSSSDITKNLEYTSDIIYCINNQRKQSIEIRNNYFAIYDETKVVSVEKSNGQVNTISENIFDSVFGLDLLSSSKEHTMIYVANANTQYAYNKYAAIPRSNLEIFNNTITSFQHEAGIIGISLEGKSTKISGNVRINNRIAGNKFFDFCGYDAIILNSVSRTLITFNLVRGYIAASGLPSGRGIVILGTTERPSTSNTVCTNTVDFTQTNFDFKGLCNGLSFSNNAVERGKVGLGLSTYAPLAIYQPVIGQQFSVTNGVLSAFENIWRWNTKTPLYTPLADAQYIGKPDDVYLSQFKVDINNNQYPNAPQIINVPVGAVPTDLFDPVNDFILTYPNSCEGGPPPTSFIPDKEWTVLEQAILDGTYGNEQPVSAWEAKCFLYDKLLENPNLLDDHPERIAFMQAASNTSIHTFTTLKRAMDASFQLSEEQAIALDGLTVQRETLLQDSHQYLLEIANLYGENPFPASVRAMIEQKSNAISAVSNSIKELNTAINTAVTDRLSNLLVEAENISTSENYEEDYKTVYRFWIKAALQDGFLSVADLALVRDVADNCMLRSGSAVLHARDLLPACEEYPYEAGCDNSPIVSKQAKNNTTTTFSSYPNPVDAVLYYNAQHIDAASTITMTDINGRALVTKILNYATGQIDTQNLPNGIYMIKIRDINGNSLTTEKVVVQH